MCPAVPRCALLCPSVPCSDNTDLEAVLKETERQRREFAARYAFMTLDTDGDGYVSVEQVSPIVLLADTCTPTCV
jgi:Ca2+-binding EF-hand superfamily protein